MQIAYNIYVASKKDLNNLIASIKCHDFNFIGHLTELNIKININGVVFDVFFKSRYFYLNCLHSLRLLYR